LLPPFSYHLLCRRWAKTPYTKDSTWGSSMSSVTRLLAGNWGNGASFLAVAQTFLMMWQNQTSKFLYTLWHSVTLQHCVLQHSHILHLHCYCLFTANCWCAVCLLLQWTNSTPAAGYQPTLAQKIRTCKHWNAPVVTECYNVESLEVTLYLHHLKTHGMYDGKIFLFSITSRQAMGPMANGGCFFLGIKLCGSVADHSFPPLYFVLG
jgi:hypothetical protein